MKLSTNIIENDSSMMFICDESGAKGYADKDESLKCEFGLFAGYFLKNKGQQENVRKLLNKSFNIIKWPNSKKHINELSKENKQSIIKSVFTVFRDEKIDCLYEGEYVHDCYRNYKEQEKTLKEIKEQRRSKIRIIEHDDIPLLHDELFNGLLVKAIGYYEKFDSRCKLDIIIDHVDESIFKLFKKTKGEILNLFKEKCNPVPGWDPEKKEKVQGEIKIKYNTEKYAYKFDESDITMRRGEQNDPLIVAADVLVYALYKYFEKQNLSGDCVSLNDKLSLECFEYKDVINELSFSNSLYWI